MPHAFIIEVDSETAGIVVQDGRAFRFYASTHAFNGLEGRAYSSPREAERAATRHLAERRHDRSGASSPPPSASSPRA